MTGERWARALASMPEGEVVSLCSIGLTELAYRHRCTVEDVKQRLQGLGDPWEVVVDAASHEERPRRTLIGALWETVTGRAQLKRSRRTH